VIAIPELIRHAGRAKTLCAARTYGEQYRFDDGAWRIAHTRLLSLFAGLEE